MRLSPRQEDRRDFARWAWAHLPTWQEEDGIWRTYAGAQGPAYATAVALLALQWHNDYLPSGQR